VLYVGIVEFLRLFLVTTLFDRFDRCTIDFKADSERVRVGFVMVLLGVTIRAGCAMGARGVVRIGFKFKLLDGRVRRTGDVLGARMTGRAAGRDVILGAALRVLLFDIAGCALLIVLEPVDRDRVGRVDRIPLDLLDDPRLDDLVFGPSGAACAIGTT